MELKHFPKLLGCWRRVDGKQCVIHWGGNRSQRSMQKRRAGVYCIHFSSVFEQKDGHREMLRETTLFLLYRIHQIIFLQESQFQSYLSAQGVETSLVISHVQVLSLVSKAAPINLMRQASWHVMTLLKRLKWLKKNILKWLKNISQILSETQESCCPSPLVPGG